MCRYRFSWLTVICQMSIPKPLCMKKKVICSSTNPRISEQFLFHSRALAIFFVTMVFTCDVMAMQFTGSVTSWRKNGSSEQGLRSTQHPASFWSLQCTGTQSIFLSPIFKEYHIMKSSFAELYNWGKKSFNSYYCDLPDKSDCLRDWITHFCVG